MSSGERIPDEPLSIYVHIPYCVAKCPYCDFNSFAVGASPHPSSMPENDYVEALLTEFQLRSDLIEGEGRKIKTVFFGGGTPSLFAARSIERLLREFARRWEFEDRCEITLEANPGTIQEQLGEAALREFRSAGVNRISMGAQSFHTWKLQKLGRLHSGDETAAAVANVNNAGFENFNLDLISGVEGDTVESWGEELEAVVRFGSPHLSVYSLTLEPGTEFGRLYRRGVDRTCGEEVQGELYRATQEFLGARGYEQYEVSNYAKPLRECQHNLVYWNRGEYLGLGAGAHGFIQPGDSWGERWMNIPGPAHYIQKLRARELPSQRTEILTREQALLELLFVRTRVASGFSFEELAPYLDSGVRERMVAVAHELRVSGLLTASNDVQLSAAGFLFADEVIKKLVESLN